MTLATTPQNSWILLLHSDAEGAQTLAESLVATGYEVVTCANAAEAEVALDSRGAPKVVLTDLALQDMRGTDLVARMRNRPGFEFVPVIFVTGSEPSLLDDVRDPVVSTPLDMDRVLELVAQHCSNGG
jgi:CheY-like chemotaxis protein